MSKTLLALTTPVVTDAAAFAPQLEAALQALKPASVHLVGSAGIEPRALQALVQMVAGSGAAVLIDPPEDWREVARLGADGVHLSDPRQLDAALEALKPQRIVGCGGLKTRDAAMTAGDSGVDYLMFGEPRADGSLPPLDQVIERCEWWAKVFTVACIGYAPGADVVTRIAATGAEFVALGAWLFEGDPAAITARCQMILDQLKS